jgi:hypothetical protein
MHLRKTGILPSMPKPLAAIAATSLSIAFVVAGCGSSSTSTSTSTPSGAGAPTTSTNAGSPPSSPANSPTTAGSGESQQPSRGTGEEFGKNDPYSAPKGGDNSIQTYGSEAAGADKAAVTTAMFAFFRALAAKQYDKICEMVSPKTRAGIEQFMKLQHKKGNCATVLEGLIGASPGGTEEAKKAAEGSVGHVRIGEGNAFVLFTPKGGKPSYFVMKKEGGEWRATGFNAGTPLNP